MYAQREKYFQISIVSLALAFLIGFIAMIKASYLLILISLYCLAASLISEAFALYISFRHVDGWKQFIRGILLFVFTTYLLFKLIRGL